MTPSIRGYYALQAVRETLEEALPPTGTPALQDASEDQVVALVEPLYAVLDSRGVFDVQGTTLSKILHRKRPHFLVLHDNWVRTCYQDAPGAPVPRQKGRTWAAYMAAISLAIRTDLRDHLETWTALLDAARPDDRSAVTLVRVLDIVAWHAGQTPEKYGSPA